MISSASGNLSGNIILEATPLTDVSYIIAIWQDKGFLVNSTHDLIHFPIPAHTCNSMGGH